MSEPQQPKPTILEVPKDYYDMSPEEQDAVLSGMAEILMREQAAEPKPKRAVLAQVPDDWDEMTPEQQEAWALEMVRAVRRWRQRIRDLLLGPE